MALAPFSDSAAFGLAFGVIGLMVIVIIMRANYKKKHYFPLIAATPRGLVVSRDGRPGRFEILSWSVVADRLRNGPRPWRWGTDLVRDLKVLLPLNASRELFSEVTKRVEVCDITAQPSLA